MKLKPDPGIKLDCFDSVNLVNLFAEENLDKKLMKASKRKASVKKMKCIVIKPSELGPTIFYF